MSLGRPTVYCANCLEFSFELSIPHLLVQSVGYDTCGKCVMLVRKSEWVAKGVEGGLALLTCSCHVAQSPFKIYIFEAASIDLMDFEYILGI